MDDRAWLKANLHGAGAIARLCAVYEITDTRIPGSRFKAKVLQRGDAEYIASLNVCLKDAQGSPDWMAGLGRTELEALEDALKWFMSALKRRDSLGPDDFEWSDPLDF
jgi:hypothetical protein